MIRLANGTKNDLLNSAFNMATIENNSWIQAVYFMLSSNSYSESWLYPPGVDCNFYLAFRQRLRDQFIQHWKATIHASNRFRFLSQVKEEFRRIYYINSRKGPEIRLTYTRLRIDNNVYSSHMMKCVKPCQIGQGFDISTKFKLLLDLQCPDYLFQTCCTYVHELYSERQKHIWLFHS